MEQASDLGWVPMWDEAKERMKGHSSESMSVEATESKLVAASELELAKKMVRWTVLALESGMAGVLVEALAQGSAMRLEYLSVSRSGLVLALETEQTSAQQSALMMERGSEVVKAVALVETSVPLLGLVWAALLELELGALKESAWATVSALTMAWDSE